ncbi:uronyl 2-sulfotransferase-like, partial [Lytechinus variegatus]|uniref:uronyl 2-sulfotransferase-like n=1 Tax=Lytechinus variegatus TaxID=7654 RepID=UPI001BB1D11E
KIATFFLLQVKTHVIFNRVGKCGSRSVLNLLQSLARDNHFYLISSLTYNEKRLTSKNREKLVSILSSVKSPFIYQRHLHFVNFRQYGIQHPTYINIIRDPLERAVSHYYFIRFGDERKQERKYSQNSTDPRRLMSYEQCVIQDDPDCTGKKSFYIIPFFCGHDPRCRIPGEWALKRAIENVKKHYVAVGILEELQDSLQVLEKVLPNMFKGALDSFLRFEQIAQSNKSSVGVTKYKQKPSAKTALYVRNVLMKYEYQFYNWIKDRLHQQMTNLGIKSYRKSYR